MLYQFVHGVSYIPEDILLLHPPSNYDTCNCSYFSVPYARTNAYYYSFFPHMLGFWNSLPINIPVKYMQPNRFLAIKQNGTILFNS